VPSLGLAGLRVGEREGLEAVREVWRDKGIPREGGGVRVMGWADVDVMGGSTGGGSNSEFAIGRGAEERDLGVVSIKACGFGRMAEGVGVGAMSVEENVGISSEMELIEVS
jgi:hypothetical protein